MHSLTPVYDKKAESNRTICDLKKAAQVDDGSAAYQLAQKFIKTKESDKAENWANVGAELGHTESMHCLALLSFDSNFDRTMYWLEEGAKGHHQKCMITLGDYFLRGVISDSKNETIILPSNSVMARYWYKRASDEKNVDAKICLGNMDYKIGHYSEALQWYQKAEKLKSGEAMKRIGDLYRKGWGVTEDRDLARTYYERAITAGYKEGRLGLDALDHKIKHCVRGVLDFLFESSE